MAFGPFKLWVVVTAAMKPMREVLFMSGETVLTVVGNLTSDPELRYTQNGLAVCNFTVASTPRTLDRASGEWKDGDTLFLRASVWRDVAEHVAATLTKGSRVIVVGRLSQRSYETKPSDGGAPEKRTSYELDVDEVGPSLKYVTAVLHRITSQTAPEKWADAAPGFLPTDATAALV